MLYGAWWSPEYTHILPIKLFLPAARASATFSASRRLFASPGITGGVVTRSGYIFQMYLPSAAAVGVPEGDTGGVGATAPDAVQSEVLWCCYAWPSSFGNSGKRTFFVNQTGDFG